MPEFGQGKRIFLWCGGADETAKVWVNGQVIGISPGATFYPFEMDATAGGETGQERDRGLRVEPGRERSRHGWHRGAGDPLCAGRGRHAKLENSGELKPTFP